MDLLATRASRNIAIVAVGFVVLFGAFFMVGSERDSSEDLQQVETETTLAASQSDPQDEQESGLELPDLAQADQETPQTDEPGDGSRAGDGGLGQSGSEEEPSTEETSTEERGGGSGSTAEEESNPKDDPDWQPRVIREGGGISSGGEEDGSPQDLSEQGPSREAASPHNYGAGEDGEGDGHDHGDDHGESGGESGGEGHGESEGQLGDTGAHHDPLGTGAAPGDLSETDRGRAQTAASQFLTYAYGYTGADYSEYTSNLNTVVLNPEFYSTTGAGTVRAYGEEISAGGVESTVMMEELEFESESVDGMEVLIEFTVDSTLAELSHGRYAQLLYLEPWQNGWTIVGGSELMQITEGPGKGSDGAPPESTQEDSQSSDQSNRSTGGSSQSESTNESTNESASESTSESTSGSSDSGGERK